MVQQLLYLRTAQNCLEYRFELVKVYVAALISIEGVDHTIDIPII